MVFFSVSEIKIKTAQHILKEAGIVSFTIDKKDSAHAGLFGDIELYVEEDSQKEAHKLLIEAEILEK